MTPDQFGTLALKLTPIVATLSGIVWAFVTKDSNRMKTLLDGLQNIWAVVEQERRKPETIPPDARKSAKTDPLGRGLELAKKELGKEQLSKTQAAQITNKLRAIHELHTNPKLADVTLPGIMKVLPTTR